MVTIGVDILLSDSALYENWSLENIKKLYKSAGKFNDQNQYKDIIEAPMVFTSEGGYGQHSYWCFRIGHSE